MFVSFVLRITTSSEWSCITAARRTGGNSSIPAPTGAPPGPPIEACLRIREDCYAPDKARLLDRALCQLARCGLRDVKLVISDAHQGIQAAVAKVLTAIWQRCRVHF